MGESIEFIKARAIATLAAANAVASQWVWQEKTIAQMETQHQGITAQENLVGDANGPMLTARAEWDAALDTLHVRTMQGVAMAKTRFRNNPVKLALVENLEARGDSRAAILREALEWEKAWKQTEQTWSPMPANTFAAFGTLRLQCLEPLQHAYKDKQSAWREASNILTELGRAMEDVNEAWYADATRAFVQGTPEGNMIRGTIPTTSDGSPPPPTPPTPPGP